MVSFNPGVPIQQTVQGLLTRAQPPPGEPPRVPFEFTSTLRQILDRAREAGGNGAPASSQEVSEALARDGLIISPSEVRLIVNRFGVTGQTLSNPLQMAINPSSISLDQPKRIARKDVRNGTVFFHFADSNGQDNDILKMQFQGSSGNLDLRATQFPTPATQDPQTLLKLQRFHELYLMTREPRTLGGNIVNDFQITFRTKVFPVDIVFTGFFENVLSFNEKADKPHSVDWEFTFVVQGTDPSLDDVILDVLQLNSEQIEEGQLVPDPNSTLFPGATSDE